MAKREFICGDSLVELANIPDGSIDLILTDPPYGDGIGYGRLDKEILNNEDESINYKVLPILYQKLKEGGGLLPLHELAVCGPYKRFYGEPHGV